MKLWKVCDSSFFAALGIAVAGDVGSYIGTIATDAAAYMKMHYNQICTFPVELLPEDPDFPQGAAKNANFVEALYGDAIRKSYEALNLRYEALNLIDLTKSISFDADDSHDRTLSSSSDSTSNSSTTYDDNTPVLTGTVSHAYTRTDNTDIVLDHDTEEHTTGTDGRKTPQEMIDIEMQFRIKAAFIPYLCEICKDAFDSGVYEEGD